MFVSVCAVLGSVFSDTLIYKGHLNRDLKEVRRQAIGLFREREFQARGCRKTTDGKVGACLVYLKNGKEASIC